jgi:ribulose kinase
MAKKKYAIGVDFGTESGRAVLVEVATGKEVAEAVYAYKHGVIDEVLPDAKVRLEHDWALQDPKDYLRVFKRAIPAVLKQSSAHAAVRAGRVPGPSPRLGQALEAPRRPTRSRQDQPHRPPDG